MPTDIAILIPVYNEEENILALSEEIHAVMRGLPYQYELIFVDDASQDQTPARIKQAQQANPHVRGLRHRQNFGQSAAVWTGIQATTAPILATLDGDRQNDPSDLPRLLAELQHADFVCGVRLHRQDDWIRRTSSRVSRCARRAFLGVDFRDTGCAMRVFKRSALNGVFPFNGWHRLLPVLIHGGGATTREVAVNHRPRVAGVSKYGIWNRVGWGFLDLLALAWYRKRRLPPVTFIELERESS